MAACLVAGLCFLAMFPSPAICSLKTLNLFLQWNEVPTEIALGLLSSGSDVRLTKLVNGTCFQYKPGPGGFARCKYYSDCCAMTPGRPLEQLDTGTFSCHNGYYIVDRCPASTGYQNLKELCEQRVESDISIRKWPVRGVLNHVTYKNIFCAICNGLDLYNETDNLIRNETRVEWWPAKVHCPKTEIESYHKDAPDHKKLVDMITRSCKVTFYPPQSPDLCWEAVRSCPDSASAEMRRLCEFGPANYVNITRVGKVFRNQFCALCHGLDLASYQQPRDLESMYASSSWIEDRLEEGQPQALEDELLAALQPRLDVGNYSADIFSSFQTTINILCSWFSNPKHDFCEDIIIVRERANSSEIELPIWNLGSLGCFSQLHGVCDQFLVSEFDSLVQCTSPGCGAGYVLDLATKNCLGVKEYQPSQVIRSLKQTWHSEILCSYRSQCRAATLGLVSEEELNCFCDKYCIYFNDCCEDSPHQPTIESKLEVDTFSCIKDASDIRSGASESRFFWGLMEVNKCPHSYVDRNVVQLCEEAPNVGRYTGVNYGLIHTPVSSSETGLRYRNIYCARCHGVVSGIKFWKVDIGCSRVYNDICRTIVDSHDFYNIVTLRNNPLAYSLASSDCRVKQFLSPEGTPDPRRCRYDAEKLVSDCPEYMKDWEISHQCRSAPTSFVYEGGGLDNILQGWVNFRQFNHWHDYGAVSEHVPSRKFRNGYCASCNSAAWLGCHVKQSFTAGDATAKKYIQYNKDVSPYMFVYRIDLERRACHFDSDSFITTANYTSGFDTCEGITHQLNSCDCVSVIDMESSNCVPINKTNEKCEEQVPNRNVPRISSYAADVCGLNHTFLLSSICSDAIVVDGVKFFFESIDHMPANFPCSDRIVPYSCFSPHNRSDCITAARVRGNSVSLSLFIEGSHIAILNSIALAYKTINFDSIVSTLERQTVAAGFELLFDQFEENDSKYCAKFSAVNLSLSDFSICPNDSIVDRIDGEIHNDYLLRDNQTMICTEYQQPLFVLHIYHYVLCGLSILVSLAYVLFYFAKNTKTMTGNFFTSKLLTLSAALFTYCFVLTATNNVVTCRVVSSLIHYLMLSVHTWTNVLAVWMFRGIATMKIVKSSGRKTYCLYAVYAWCTPLLFVALSYILYAYPILELSPVFSDKICFLADGWVRVLLFTGPIYLQILVDVILCIYAIVVVVRSGRNLGSNRQKDETKRKVITVVKLQVIFGVQWLLLFFTESKGSNLHTLWSTFNVLVSIQGILIVLAQVLNVKNISNCLQLRNKNMDTPQTSNRTTSSQI